MKGEKEFFRKRFFGGFNREDVVKYIAKIADERNEALAAQETAEKKVQELTEELSRLREGTDKAVEGPVVIEEAVEEPAVESVVESAVESVVEPVVESVVEPVTEPVAIPAEPVSQPQAYTLPPLEVKKEPAPPVTYTLPPLETRKEPAAPQASALPPLESINIPVAPPVLAPITPLPEQAPAPASEEDKKPKTARLKVKRR